MQIKSFRRVFLCMPTIDAPALRVAPHSRLLTSAPECSFPFRSTRGYMASSASVPCHSPRTHSRSAPPLDRQVSRLRDPKQLSRLLPFQPSVAPHAQTAFGHSAAEQRICRPRFYQSSGPSSASLPRSPTDRHCKGDANSNRLKIQDVPSVANGALRQLSDSGRRRELSAHVGRWSRASCLLLAQYLQFQNTCRFGGS